MSRDEITFDIFAVQQDIKITNNPPQWSSVLVGSTVNHTFTASRAGIWSVTDVAGNPVPGLTIESGVIDTAVLSWTPVTHGQISITVSVNDGSSPAVMRGTLNVQR